MKVYLMVDWDYDKTFFLENYFHNENIALEIIGIPNYNRRDRETKLGSIKLYFKYLILSIKTIKLSSKDDVIICWNFTTAIPLGLLNKLLKKKRKIIALNIIAPVHNKIVEGLKNRLFQYALKQKNILITVNSAELIASYSYRLKLSIEKFFVLHDPIFDSYKSSEFVKKDSYIFCGGEARRDWKTIVKAAELTPELSYVFVARKKYFDLKTLIPGNVKIYFDIPQEEYYKLFEESTIIALPLKDKKPAGLINLIRAAMLSIPIVSSNTPSINNYIENNISGILVKMNDPVEFSTALKRIYDDFEIQENYANNLKKSIVCNFSKESYSSRLIDIINTLA
ncbi:glycosyltransferase [Sediminicola sp. 1XM1-17]|uniref:glycosyltransferase n=1 Tax=Sediminicola sp. 1XM1-17 TaxID=3127702 RepID=UPI0030780063